MTANTNNTETLSEDEYFARDDRISALYNAHRITDEQETGLTVLLDRADAYGEHYNLRIVDGMLNIYEALS